MQYIQETAENAHTYFFLTSAWEYTEVEASFKCSQAEAKSKTQGTKIPMTERQESGSQQKYKKTSKKCQEKG